MVEGVSEKTPILSSPVAGTGQNASILNLWADVSEYR